VRTRAFADEHRKAIIARNGDVELYYESIGSPEDPTLDFASQTSFVAMLDRRPQQEGAGTPVETLPG